jgi:hypothetical protein
MGFVVGLLLPLASVVLWPSMLLVVLGILGLYAIAIMSATVLAARTEFGLHLLLLPAALLTLHLSYGFGSVWGGILLTRRMMSHLTKAVKRLFD